MKHLKEIQTLEDQIRYHNKRYFQDNSPEIADYHFDKLVTRLKKICPSSPVLVEISDSQWFNTFDKITRDEPMLSLEKCYSEEEIMAWAEDVSEFFIGMVKIDGCAIELLYDEDGILVLAATRGNGFEGEDVTLNAMVVENIPKKIGFGPIEVRGEVYMKKSVFEEFKDQYANPRNLAAGGLHQKFASDCEKLKLSFLAYDVHGSPHSAGSDYTETQKFEFLKSEGFEVVENLPVISIDQLQTTYEYFSHMRDLLDYEIDGVVFKAGYVRDQARLGRTSHHPRYAIAYKFQGESGETKLKEVQWQVSRNGRITPVALVEPIKLSGATIKNITLHNLKTFNELDLRINDVVLITRSGGVIPYFEKVIKKAAGNAMEAPEACPDCAGPVETTGDFLSCINHEGCRGARELRLQHFLETIDCEGFGPGIISKLYETLSVRNPADLYDLEVSDLLKLEGVADGLAKKLHSGLQKKRKLKLEIFLAALGIPSLGLQTAKLIAKKFRNLEQALGSTIEAYTEIDGVGELTAKAIKKWFLENYSIVNDLLERVEVETVSVKMSVAESKFEGKNFLFTGTLVSMTRTLAQNAVLDLGGAISGSVNKDLDFLVVGDGGGAGSKLDKAVTLQEKGAKVQIITEAVWLQMIKDPR